MEGEQLELEGVGPESAADAATRQRAESMGWIPPERYKGDSAKFVDADEYIRRGEEVLPILQSHNKKLREELAEMRAQQARTARELTESRKILDEINERHAVEQQKVIEDTRKQTRDAIALALREGDNEAAAALMAQLSELTAIAKKEPPPKPAPDPAPTTDPVFDAWRAENSWYGTNQRASAYAEAVARTLRAEGDRSVGKVFYENVATEVYKIFPDIAPEGREGIPDRVTGARHTRGNGKPEGKSYRDLPADAKAACDADVKRFVGEGKKYKTADAWRAAYASMYFEE